MVVNGILFGIMTPSGNKLLASSIPTAVYLVVFTDFVTIYYIFSNWHLTQVQTVYSINVISSALAAITGR